MAVNLLSLLALLTAFATGATADPVSVAAITPVQWDDTRYLDVDRLAPGMAGIAKTVFSGTQVETFDVEIVDVRPNVAPGRSMILARCHGPNIERTRVAQGMSGSPVYVTDPLDGRLKLIGAIAYGWAFQTGTLTGIQPIRGMLEATKPIDVGGSAVPRLAADPQDRFVLAGLREDALTPSPPPQPTALGLQPLSTPLVMAGGSPSAMAWLSRQTQGSALTAVGGGAPNHPSDEPTTTLAPGSVLAIPILQGAMSLTAVGTVTDVVDGVVMGFGHALNAEGKTALPLAAGTIHAIVPSTAQPFKIGSATQTVGILAGDQYTAVAGMLGQQARLIPLEVTVVQDGQEHTDTYQIADHDYFTPLASVTALISSVTRRHEPLREHTIRYTHTIDFADLGRLVLTDTSSQAKLKSLQSDMLSPILMMLGSPFGRATVERITSHVEVDAVARAADIERAEILRNTVRPGETIQIDVGWLHYGGKRTTRRYNLKLDDTLKPGRYKLTVCDAANHIKALRQERPHLFMPRSQAERFEAIKMIATIRQDRVYLRLVPITKDLPIAVDGTELPDLPSSRAQVLADSKHSGARPYTAATVATWPLQFVASGSQSFDVVIDKDAPQ